MKNDTRPLLATLIDADNVPAKYAEEILKEVASIGTPALRRVYGDWTSGALKGWSEQILALGLVAQQQTANTKNKNASDIGLVIDAMDILHEGRFDGFVLVSSDSDFTALANRLREDGVMVIGIGEKKAPVALRNVCDRFIFIENLIADEPQTNAEQKPAKKEQPATAAKLFSEAMRRIPQEDEWFHLGQLGQAVVAAHPDFDTRTYGKSKLSELVSAIKGLETKKEGNSVYVRKVTGKTKAP